MAGKGTDRKGKTKEVKSAVNDINYDTLSAFTLPDSLPCSEVEFPILLKTANKANWFQIVEESEERLKEIEEYSESKKEPAEFLSFSTDFKKEEVLNSTMLWNNNPRYPERKLNNLHLFNMPWVQKHLKKYPRPYYPKSWLWPEDYAATLIQKTVRQYFVQRKEDVQEMREFWKKLDIEQSHPEMHSNPLLAKKFASQQGIHKK
ncbi:unnamed protein product, partial [Brenthis ino]